MKFSWQSAQLSHRGKLRESNEDAVLSRPDQGLWAVADGMGGHDAGDVASQSIANALGKVMLGQSLAEDVDAVEDALVLVNDELRHHARTRCKGNTVGSTVVAMLSKGDVGVVLWAGDSRLYRLRNSSLEQITRDHNPVSDLMESGVVSESEALATDTNIITRAVGGQPELYLDVAVFDVSPTDTYLLCSDGLYRELEVKDLIKPLGWRDPDASAEALLDRCLDSAARDNVSLVVAQPEVR